MLAGGLSIECQWQKHGRDFSNLCWWTLTEVPTPERHDCSCMHLRLNKHVTAINLPHDRNEKSSPLRRAYSSHERHEHIRRVSLDLYVTITKLRIMRQSGAPITYVSTQNGDFATSKRSCFIDKEYPKARNGF